MPCAKEIHKKQSEELYDSWSTPWGVDDLKRVTSVDASNTSTVELDLAVTHGEQEVITITGTGLPKIPDITCTEGNEDVYDEEGEL